MENVLVDLLLSTPWVKEVLVSVGVYVATLLTIAGAAHTFTTGVLRPLAKLTPNKEDDKYVEILAWWTDAVSDVLREWALGKWVAGWQRAKRMWNDKQYPVSDPRRRWA